MADLKAQIDVSVDASGVDVGINQAKKSLRSMGATAAEAGRDASKGIGQIGQGGDQAAKAVDKSTRNIIGSIERQIATMQAGSKTSAEYYRVIANQRGVDVRTLEPYLKNLDAITASTKQATSSFGGMGSAAQKLGSVLTALGAVTAVGFAANALKGALALGDQLDDLSEKSGVTVERLSALRYAGEVTGTSFDAVGTGLRKLSQNMAAAAGGAKEQSAAFTAVGVSVKNLDGSLRGSDQVLADLADRFASFKDGPAKAALAIELFGKSGADLIPLLNKGSDGIANLSAEGEKLGAVFGGELATQSAAFNDNLKKIELSLQGATAQVVGQLLPTLDALTKEFLAAREGGSSFAQTLGEEIAGGVKAVTLAAVSITALLRTLGNEFKTLAGLSKAAFTFDFKGFKEISDAGIAQRGQAFRDADATMARLNGAGSSAGAGSDGRRNAASDPRSLLTQRVDAPIVTSGGGGRAGGSGGGSGSGRKPVDDYKALNDEIAKRVALLEAETKAGRALTESEKLTLSVQEQLTAGKIKLSAAEQATLQTRIASLAKLETQNTVEKALFKAAEESALARQQLATKEADSIAQYLRDQQAATAQSLAGVRDRITSLQDEAEAADLSTAKNISLAEAIELIAIKRLEEKQARTVVGSPAYEEVERELKARRELAGLIGSSEARKANADAAKDAANEWKKTTDQINQSLTDALLRGFESGKGFGENFRDTLKNLFKTLVLRPVISFIVNPIGNAISGLVSSGLNSISGGLLGNNAGGGGTSLASLFSNGSSLNSLFNLGTNSAGYIGSGVGSVFGQATGNAATAYALTGDAASSVAAANAAAAANGTAGTVAGTQAGLSTAGSVASVAIPLAAFTALFAAFGGFAGKAPVQSGLGGTVSEGNSALLDFTEFRRGGSLFGAGPRYGTGGTATGANDPLRLAVQTAVDAGIEAGRARGNSIGISPDALAGFRTNFGTDVINSSARANVFTDDRAIRQANGLEVFSPDRLGLRLDGLSKEERDKKIAEAYAKFQDDVAKQVLGVFEYATQTLARETRIDLGSTNQGIDSVSAYERGPDELYTETTRTERASAFIREGETATAALNRLSDSLAGVNTVFKTLGNTLFDVSLQGADAASKLIDAFGGLDAFNQTTSSFFANFYSEQELQDTRRAQLQSQLAGQGFTDIDTRAEFRTQADILGDAAATGGDAAARAYADFLRLNEAFAALYPNVEAVTDALDNTAQAAADAAAAEAEAAAERARNIAEERFGLEQQLRRLTGRDREALDLDRGQQYGRLQALDQSLADLANTIFTVEDAISGVDDGFARLERSVQVQRQIAEEAVNNLTSIFDTLRGNVRELYGEVDSTSSASARSGNSFITDALAAARTTGYLPDAEQLSEAIANARGGLDSSNYSSAEDFNRDRLVLAGRLSTLGEITGQQLTAAEQELEYLDQTLQTAKDQLDTMRGVDLSVISVADAVRDLRDLMAKEGKYRPGGAAAGVAAGGLGTSGASRAVLGAAGGLQGFIIDVNGNKVPSNSAWDGTGTAPDWAITRPAGPSTYTIAANQYAASQKSGEMSFDTPVVMSMLKSGGASGAELVEEVRALAKAMEGVQTAVANGNVHTAKTASLLASGEPLAVRMEN